MKVAGMLLYHISLNDTFKVGDILVAGEQENPFWCKCKDISVIPNVNHQDIPLFQMFETYPLFDVTQQNIDFLYNTLRAVAFESSLYIREQIFETVRREFYPSLPSRQKCLWLTEQNMIPYWKTMSEKQQYLLTAEIEGEVFCGDDYWLTADTLSSVTYEVRAHHYWSGKMSENPRKEYLVQGKAIIKDIYPL